MSWEGAALIGQSMPARAAAFAFVLLRNAPPPPRDDAAQVPRAAPLLLHLALNALGLTALAWRR